MIILRIKNGYNNQVLFDMWFNMSIKSQVSFSAKQTTIFEFKNTYCFIYVFI